MPRNLPNWIDAYLQYTAEQESPTELHWWVAVNVIAGALERQVFFDMGYYQAYPNLYILLVSPPGKCKKSTAMRMGRDILKQVPGIKFTTDSASREVLIRDLAQAHKDGQSAMTAYSSEFGTLLTTSQMSMVVFLTDIYDCPNDWAHKTLSGGTNTIKQPYLNMIAGTTPNWMASGLPLDTIGVGLMSRIICVYADQPRIRPPIPKLSTAQKNLGILLAEDLADIADIAGEYKFTPEADALYTEWYMGRGNTDAIDPRISGYFERKPAHLIKLCMILTAAENNELWIEAHTIQAGLEALEKTEEKLDRVFAHVGRNPYNADLQAILSAIAVEEDGITRVELIKRFRHNLDAEGFDKTIQTLLAASLIQLHPGGKYTLHPSARA